MHHVVHPNFGDPVSNHHAARASVDHHQVGMLMALQGGMAIGSHLEIAEFDRQCVDPVEQRLAGHRLKDRPVFLIGKHIDAVPAEVARVGKYGGLSHPEIVTAHLQRIPLGSGLDSVGPGKRLNIAMNWKSSAPLMLALTLASVASARDVTGTVSYRERIALPANAVVSVRLEETGIAGTPPRMVSELNVASGGRQVPFSFRLPFEQTMAARSRRFQLRARITVGDQQMFSTSEPVPVITNGVWKANLVVKKIGPSENLILGTTWKLKELNGKPALPGRSGTPTITFDKGGAKFSSHTGVNSLSGTFRISGASISISPGMQTLIGASPEMMEQEKDFSSALKAANSYRLVNGTLELLKGADIIARFER